MTVPPWLVLSPITIRGFKITSAGTCLEANFTSGITFAFLRNRKPCLVTCAQCHRVGREPAERVLCEKTAVTLGGRGASRRLAA